MRTLLAPNIDSHHSARQYDNAILVFLRVGIVQALTARPTVMSHTPAGRHIDPPHADWSIYAPWSFSVIYVATRHDTQSNLSPASDASRLLRKILFLHNESNPSSDVDQSAVSRGLLL